MQIIILHSFLCCNIDDLIITISYGIRMAKQLNFQCNFHPQHVKDDMIHISLTRVEMLLFENPINTCIACVLLPQCD